MMSRSLFVCSDHPRDDMERVQAVQCLSKGTNYLGNSRKRTGFDAESPRYDKDEDFICGICKREIRNPKLLACLHSFCLDCLLILESEALPKLSFSGKRIRPPRDITKIKWKDMVLCKGEGNDLFGISNNAYQSEGSESSENYNLGNSKIVQCPACGFSNTLPKGGVADLPHNYLLQHRLLLATMNKSDVRLLCDLCRHEVLALCRCTSCLLNLCEICSATHKNVLSDHEMVALNANEKSGLGITRIRQQAMCPTHPQHDIKFFCASCNQMTCKKCSLLMHRDHSCGLLSKAARVYRNKIKEVLNQTMFMIKEVDFAKTQSESIFPELLSNCVSVKKDIDSYINSYIEALEEHRKGLKLQVEQARYVQLQSLKQKLVEVERRQKESNHALKFGEDLLSKGSDFEVISLATPLLRRLEWIIQSACVKSKIKSKPTGLIQFLRDERAGTIKSHLMYGIVTNQMVSPNHSSLTPEGLNSLKNCKQKQQCQVKLISRDANNKPITHGGENVDVDLRYENNLRRQVPTLVIDKEDGTYIITFSPDSSGSMRLSITIRSLPIKGSPFTVMVKKTTVHNGVFHCCTFCSSGGSKKALCACGGRMPGGYLGCGHGHAGHPGKNHWSCCGNTFPNSECLQKPFEIYHLTF